MHLPRPNSMSIIPRISTLSKVVWVTAVVAQALAADRTQEREPTPAVINPALRSPLRQTLSLDGIWDFAVDPSEAGEAQKYYDPDVALPNRIPIRVPGCWEAQGVGGPGNSSSVAPERSIRALRGSYCGTAWYRKDLILPRDWAGKQVWLKLGGVHAQGWFWVNGQYAGHNACYCGAYKYNITDLVHPGEPVVIAAKIRNDVPSRKGLMGWIQRFGGLYRGVELDATPALLIDDAYVTGDLDQQRCVLHVKVRAVREATASPAQLEVQVETSTLDGTPAGTSRAVADLRSDSTVEVTLPVALDPFRPWSPEAPNLYRAGIVLKVDGKAIDGWVERFGVRKWEVRGGSFYLNNHPYFLRGYGDDFVYPLSLVSPASREVHREHLQLAKAYGFAYVRHHTHCELPEFYEAADELGIMVQPELPYYGATPSAGDPSYFKPKEDLEELDTHYRRYVSFSTFCTGNEGHLGSTLDREVYQLAKRLDPTRLLLHQDGGQNRKDNSDFHQGPVVPWAAGTQDASWPFTAHEYLNLATQEDPRLARKYSGALLPPVTVEDFRADLAKAGLSWEWGVATLDAGNQLQRVYQKRGLEQARLDPACDGCIYWTIVDVGSPSAQGLFNQFWEPKASTAAYFRQFNSPTVVLAKFTPEERILRAGDDFAVEWWISTLAPQPLASLPLVWRLEANQKVILSGALPPAKAEAGEVKPIGSTRLKVPEVAKPGRFKLIAELPGRDIRNSWDLWIFPRRTASADAGKGMGASPRLYPLLKERYSGLAALRTPADKECDLWLTERFDTNAVAALRQGKNVLLLQLPGVAPGVQLGWWAIGKQAGTAIARHPAFGDFPHEGFLDELLFRLSGRTVGMVENQSLRQVEPLMVTRGSAGYLLDVFEAGAGAGKLLASGLNLFSEYPEAAYLLDQFIRYARSPEFQPRGKLDLDRALKDLVFLGDVNGWTETVLASERREYASFLGQSRMCIARQTDGSSRIIWKTRPVPDQLDPAKPYTFTWVAGLGYISEPSGGFTLSVNERPLLKFNVVHSHTVWQSPDAQVTLQYEVKSAGTEDSSGLMTLSVPGALLKPGECARFQVVGSARNSRRWFGLYETESTDSLPSSLP
jgi:beta-galactosidase